MTEAKSCDHRSFRRKRIRPAWRAREISGQTTVADLGLPGSLVALANRSRCSVVQTEGTGLPPRAVLCRNGGRQDWHVIEVADRENRALETETAAGAPVEGVIPWSDPKIVVPIQ